MTAARRSADDARSPRREPADKAARRGPTFTAPGLRKMDPSAEMSLIVAIVSAAASVISAVAASVAAVGIWRGIRAMVRSNDDRAEQQREAMQLQREAEDKRHAEAMQLQRETIQLQREAMQQQREAMQQQREADDNRHSETMTALQELIRRTAPPAAATERG